MDRAVAPPVLDDPLDEFTGSAAVVVEVTPDRFVVYKLNGATVTARYTTAPGSPLDAPLRLTLNITGSLDGAPRGRPVRWLIVPAPAGQPDG